MPKQNLNTVLSQTLKSFLGQGQTRGVSEPRLGLGMEPALFRGGSIHRTDYFFATDYLRLPKFSLTNSCIFRENTQFFTKIVVVGSGDRTTCPTPVPVFQVVKRLEL